MIIPEFTLAWFVGSVLVCLLSKDLQKAYRAPLCPLYGVDPTDAKYYL